jgi:hypothetical protein
MGSPAAWFAATRSSESAASRRSTRSATSTASRAAARGGSARRSGFPASLIQSASARSSARRLALLPPVQPEEDPLVPERHVGQRGGDGPAPRRGAGKVRVAQPLHQALQATQLGRVLLDVRSVHCRWGHRLSLPAFSARLTRRGADSVSGGSPDAVPRGRASDCSTVVAGWDAAVPWGRGRSGEHRAADRSRPDRGAQGP